jgi:PST family polysaccharide transporter
MIQKIKNELIGHSGFFKVTLLSSLSSGLKIVISFVVSKFLAIYGGPAGFAMVGQMNNFLSILHAFGSGGFNTGLTKYVSENENNSEMRNRFIATTLFLMVILTSVPAIFLLAFSSLVSNYLFQTDDYQLYIAITGFMMFLYNAGHVFLAVFNGLKLFKTFIFVNILISFAGLISSLLCIYFWGIQGAVIAIIINLAFYLLVLMPFLKKADWFDFREIRFRFFSSETKKLSSFTLMFLASSSVTPIVQIALRTYLFNQYSEISAGFWEALNRFSQIPVLILTTAFSTYYLPHLAQIKTHALMRIEIRKTIKLVIPMSLFILGVLYVFRELLIRLVFTQGFEPVSDLLLWQLIGDFLRLLSFVFAYVLLAKAQTLFYILGEVFFGVCMYASAIFLLPQYGLVGITYAYSLSYFLYLVLVVFFFYRSKWDG